MTHAVAGVLLLLFAASSAFAQSSVAGAWAMSVFESERPSVMRLRLDVDGEKVTGTAGGRKIEGTLKGGVLEFKAGERSAKGHVDGDRLTGDVTIGDRTVRWTAERIIASSGTPQTHTFEPKEFHLYFSSSIPPVLRIRPGDIVRTWSVDAGGRDKAGNRRSGGGNPQTGPFYVEGAFPGDTLAVKLLKVRLNRDWAGSGSTIMRPALDPWTLGDLQWTQPFNSRWKLDHAAGIASLEKPTSNLKDFSVPIQPMLGCVAVAPPGDWSIRTVDSGRFGGNMDYNQMKEGVTLYLPVSHPGALLFMGDGHAAQGDGELTGDALETSMDIEFSVEVIPDQQFNHPIAENDEHLISIGIGGSLDQALQMATSGMVRWLERDYKLSASEAAIVMGFAIKYDVVDLVGTQVSIAAKLPKTAAAKLQKATQ